MSEKRPPGSFDIPDLELDAPLRSASTSPRRPKGLEYDDPNDDFELETAQTSLGTFGLDTESLPLPGARSGVPSAMAPWPIGATPGPGELQLEHDEIERIADYGDARVPWLRAPAYTLRVFQRHRALRKAREQTRSELSACESRRDATLAELVRKLKPELEKREQFRAGLTQLATAEQASSEQERALANASAEAQTKLGAIDAQSAALRTEIDTQKSVLDARQRLFDDCTANLKRAEARAKRAQIEIRAVHDVALKRAAAAGKTSTGQVELTADEAVRLRELEQQASALTGEVAQVRVPYVAAERELADVRRRITELEQQLQSSEQRKTAFTRQARQDLNAKGRQASQAGGALSDAYAALGRAVLSGRGAVNVDDEMLERLRQHDKEVTRAAIDDEHHLRALTVYDRDTAQRGLVVVAVTAVVLLALLIYALS